MALTRAGSAFLLLAVVSLALPAGAGTISDVGGMVQLNGEAISGDTAFPTGARLEVVGEGSKATVKTGSGDLIVLEPGSQIVLNVASEAGETYELISGAFIATLSPKTAIMLPQDGRLAVAEGDKAAKVAVESREGGTRTAIDVSEGRVTLTSGSQFKTRLTTGQAAVVEYRKAEPRKLGIESGPTNEGEVYVFDQATENLEIELRVPRATRSNMMSVENDTKTKIENSLDSSKEGKLSIVSRVRGEQTATGEVAPGVFAYVLHETGAIQFEYVEIDFQVLKRAIGLTTEFQTLAVSNFTGVLAPDASKGKTKPPPDDYTPPDTELRTRGR
jgi:hypothetical protein